MRRGKKTVCLIVGLVATLLPQGQPTAATEATTFEHVVVIIEQNHTFDSYFGTYPGANGIEAIPLPYVPVSFDPQAQSAEPLRLSNARSTALAAHHGGALDRFEAAQDARGRTGDLALTYRTRETAPILWSLADDYVLFDNYYSSSFGGSIPNTMHLFTGDDYGLATDSKSSVLALSDLDAPTVFDRLEDRAESWGLYVGRLDELDPAKVIDRSYADLTRPTPSAIYWAPPLGMPRFWQNEDLRRGLLDQEQFYRDAASGSLPAVSYVIPQPTDHPASSGDQGHVRLQSLLNSVIKSPDWDRTAVFVVWDDWGGFADHVDPPAGFGFRVPMLMVSPHAKQGYVSSVEHDHTSVLNFIVDQFALEPLSPRQEAANSFADTLATSPRSDRQLVTQHLLDPTPVGTTSQNRATLFMYIVGLGLGAGAGLVWGRRGSIDSPRTQKRGLA